MEKLRLPWQQASLSVFLILNGPGKKLLRKVCFSQPTEVRASDIHRQILNVSLTSSSPAGRFSGGADTVSKRNESITLLIASLDCIICANAIPGDGTLS